MSYEVRVETAVARGVAAVRRQVRIPDIMTMWKPALDEVWAFLARNPGLRADGHNLFLYHHPTHRHQPMDIDFGVEVPLPFAPDGDVRFIETPAGEVATTLHVGPYSKLSGAHMAVHAWAGANGRQIGAASWEIYGDWNDDETKLETQIVYLLR